MNELGGSEGGKPDQSGWDARAAGWEVQSARFERSVQSVTMKMLDWLAPASGSLVGELACGPGGMLPLLCEVVGPTGFVLASDVSPAMVQAARRTCAKAGANNVSVDEQGVDWLDLPTGELHALCCRYGYMFASDPASALIEARRVIAPGGRFATATWADPSVNPYGAIPMEALALVGLGDPPTAGGAGMFRLSDADALAEMMLDAGFLDVNVAEVPVSFSFGSVNDLFGWLSDLSQSVNDGLADGHPGSRAAFMEELSELTKPHQDPSGGLRLAGVSLVGTASA